MPLDTKTQNTSKSNPVASLRIPLVFGPNTLRKSKKRVGWMITEVEVLYDVYDAIRKEAKLNGVDPAVFRLSEDLGNLLISYGKARAQWELERDPVCDVAFVWKVQLPNSGVHLLFADVQAHEMLKVTLDKYEADSRATARPLTPEGAAPDHGIAQPETPSRRRPH